MLVNSVYDIDIPGNRTGITAIAITTTRFRDANLSQLNLTWTQHRVGLIQIKTSYRLCKP